MSTSLSASEITAVATKNIISMPFGGLITSLAEKWIGNILANIEAKLAVLPASTPVDPASPLAPFLSLVDKEVDEAVALAASSAVANLGPLGSVVSTMLTKTVGPDLKAAINAAVINGAANWATTILSPPVVHTATV